jgi:hypothetical protein
VTDLRSMWRRVMDSPFARPTPGIRAMVQHHDALGPARE